jgi:hypothetical protein
VATSIPGGRAITVGKEALGAEQALDPLGSVDEEKNDVFFIFSVEDCVLNF